jgi:hypothetical protein
MRHLVPILSVLAAWRLWARDDGSVPADRLAALLAIATFASLVQFPFSVPIYFFYSAPMIPLLLLAMLPPERVSFRERPGLSIVAGFLLVLMLVVPMRIGERWGVAGEPLLTPRGGLEMYAGDADEYHMVVQHLRKHAHGGWVWAGPDAPEIPFLTGLRNPTRTIFDCFDSDFADPEARAARILGAIDQLGITAVALHRDPAFSGPRSPPLEKGLRERFPESLRIGRYEVAWKP